MDYCSAEAKLHITYDRNYRNESRILIHQIVATSAARISRSGYFNFFHTGRNMKGNGSGRSQEN